TLIGPRIAITAGHTIKVLKEYRDTMGSKEFALGFGDICEGKDQSQTEIQLSVNNSEPNNCNALWPELPSFTTPDRPFPDQLKSVYRITKAVMLPEFAKAVQDNRDGTTITKD